jgi:hypothetical protein
VFSVVSKVSIRGANRVLVYDGRLVTVSLRWWSVLWQTIRKDRRHLPAAVTIPISVIRGMKVQEPRWWRRGRLVIDAPGRNDPWRRPTWPGNRLRPHKVLFRQRRADHWYALARIIREDAFGQ